MGTEVMDVKLMTENRLREVRYVREILDKWGAEVSWKRYDCAYETLVKLCGCVGVAVGHADQNSPHGITEPT